MSLKDYFTIGKELFQIIRKSKKWKDDITVYKGDFYKNELEEAMILMDRGIDVLVVKGWDTNQIKDIRFVLQEIITNSFKHGIKNIELGQVYIKLILSSSICKIVITDNGYDFNLYDEIKKQDPFNSQKTPSGLGLAYRITQEMDQDIVKYTNTIIVIQRKGDFPLKVEKMDDIAIYHIGKGFVDNKEYRSNLISKILKLENCNYCILNLGDNKVSWPSMVIPEFEEITRNTDKDIEILITGIDESSSVIKEYFEKKYKVFSTVQDAIDHLCSGNYDVQQCV